VPPAAAQEVIVRREEDLSAAPFGAGQVKRVEGAEPEGLQRLGAGRILAVRRDHRVGVRKYFGRVAPPVRVRIATDFDCQHGAAHPICPAFTDQPENALNSFRLIADTRLALVVGEPAQAAGVQLDSHPGEPLCVFVIADLLFDFRAVGTNIGARAGKVFGAQGPVRAQ
jgi:hypothetical protein